MIIMIIINMIIKWKHNYYAFTFKLRTGSIKELGVGGDGDLKVIFFFNFVCGLVQCFSTSHTYCKYSTVINSPSSIGIMLSVGYILY